MARKRRNDWEMDEPVEAASPPPCWLCGRPVGRDVVWHHPIPKSRGGRETVPMHPICQNMLTASFTNSELERHGMDAASLLDDPAVAKFVAWVAKKDPDFNAPLAKKGR